VLLTTQYLEEAEQLADDVCVLDGGRVVARGTPRELTAAIGGDRLELVVVDPGRALEAAQLAEQAAGTEPVADPVGGGERVVVPVARRRGVVGAVVRALDEAGIAVDDVVLRPTTLDEAYLRITGRDDRRTEVPA
jgi:ABC-2 type transport system ATP-binding protein